MLPLLSKLLRTDSVRKLVACAAGAGSRNRSPTVFAHCLWFRRTSRLDGPGALAMGPVMGSSGFPGGGATLPPPVPPTFLGPGSLTSPSKWPTQAAVIRNERDSATKGREEAGRTADMNFPRGLGPVLKVSGPD